MKYLFCTLTFFIDVSLAELIYWFVTDKSIKNCSMFAAGRLGVKVAQLKNSRFFFQFKGYKLGSISFQHEWNNIKFSFLIFSNKKVKLSMGFPKHEFDFDTFIKDTLNHYSSIFHCSISNVVFHNITTQKSIHNYPFHDITTYLKKNKHMFQRIVFPDFLVHTHHCIRCYPNDSSLHCSFNSNGTSQIFGAKSNNDILQLQTIIDTIDFDLFLDSLLA